MKNLDKIADDFKTVASTLDTTHIEVDDFPEEPLSEYFITATVKVEERDYFITTGFWPNGFDTRVEAIEDGHKVCLIEFNHTQDLKNTLETAMDKIIIHIAQEALPICKQ